MRAILTAEYRGQKQKTEISGVDNLEITCVAISKILNKAVDSDIWAKGHIILKDESGNIIREMLEK